MYIVDLVGMVVDPIAPLRYGSAFRYSGSAIRDGSNPLAFGALALAGVALATVGALLFDRRDVR